MKCPNCGHKFKDAGRSKGGQKSKRTISPEAQAKMQKARKRKIQSNSKISGCEPTDSDKH